MRVRSIKALLITIICFSVSGAVFAQSKTVKDSIEVEVLTTKKKVFYIGTAMDWGIFSSATMQRPGHSDVLGTLRFTEFLNTGVTFNFDFKNIGFFTGLDIKNIGFIEKANEYTIKHRVYNIGAPLGIKLGKLTGKVYGILGGGLDVPFNYREKEFVKRGHKEKFSEWFSDRTPHAMPYVFAGVVLRPGLSLKLQYYTNNFMNPDYLGNSGYSVRTVPDSKLKNNDKPYAGYNVHLMMLSVGFTVPYSRGMASMHMMKESQ